MKKWLFYLLFVLISFSVSSQEKARLEIRVEGIRNSQGNLSITVFNNENGFPEENGKAFLTASLDLSRERPVFIFKGLEPGLYAYAILHDEDKNDQMNKNMLGIPKEGFGFSNNYKPRIKNPSFRDASFEVINGENKHTVIMVYYL